MGFSRQKYWSGLPLPSPRYLSTHQQIKCLNSPRREDLHPWDTYIFQVRCKLMLLFCKSLTPLLCSWCNHIALDSAVPPTVESVGGRKDTEMETSENAGVRVDQRLAVGVKSSFHMQEIFNQYLLNQQKTRTWTYHKMIFKWIMNIIFWGDIFNYTTLCIMYGNSMFNLLSPREKITHWHDETSKHPNIFI